MKTLKIVYLMYEGSTSSYAESYFIPLIQGLINGGDSVLFVRVTEKNSNKKITVEGKTERFVLVNAPIGMFNLSHVKQIRQLAQNLFDNGKGGQNLVIARGIGTFWICLVSGLLTKLKSNFVYDSDGLSADEAIEFRRSWRSSVLYVPARIMEACLLLRADLVLTRSKMTKAVLQRRMPLARDWHFVELNNGCEPEKYSEVTFKDRANARESLGLSATDVVFVYLGSYGHQYEFKKMLLAFNEIEITGFGKKLLIFVPARDIAAVKQLVKEYGIQSKTYVIRNIVHEQTPFLLAAADFGFSLRQESFSMKHVKPLKTREYLFSGLSVIYSKFTGDAAGLPSDIGFVLDGTEASDLITLQSWVQQRMVNQEYFYNLAKQFALLNLSIDKDVALLSEAIQNVLEEDHS
jgi:hypothetical protein